MLIKNIKFVGVLFKRIAIEICWTCDNDDGDDDEPDTIHFHVIVFLSSIHKQQTNIITDRLCDEMKEKWLKILSILFSSSFSRSILDWNGCRITGDYVNEFIK